jgi:hypothetical protein
MRALLLAALTAVLVACGAGSAAVTAERTSLVITHWPHGVGTGHRETWTLRCNPARGSLARPAVACRRLAAGGAKLFASVPKNVACTQIYGGPQVARVTGTLAGARISATLNRRDGCQIARWNGLSPWLLPSGSVS